MKSKILLAVFGLILFAQIAVIAYFYCTTDLFQKVFPLKMIAIGPLFLLTVILSEIIFFRKLGSFQANEKSLPRGLTYFVVFIETSFPTFFISFAGFFMKDSHMISIQQLVTSPPLVMYFIMIILSSLMLDFRVSVLSGLVAGVEYFTVCYILFSSSGQFSKIDLANSLFRSLLILVSGIIAGFVSKKIKEAIQSSMESKNALIHKLDEMVAEKTKEITLKNSLLEQKQKEIIDSIYYAKRIQDALLPNEKYVDRNLYRLKDKN